MLRSTFYLTTTPKLVSIKHEPLSFLKCKTLSKQFDKFVEELQKSAATISPKDYQGSITTMPIRH